MLFVFFLDDAWYYVIMFAFAFAGRFAEEITMQVIICVGVHNILINAE